MVLDEDKNAAHNTKPDCTPGFKRKRGIKQIKNVFIMCGKINLAFKHLPVPDVIPKSLMNANPVVEQEDDPRKDFGGKISTRYPCIENHGHLQASAVNQRNGAKQEACHCKPRPLTRL